MKTFNKKQLLGSQKKVIVTNSRESNKMSFHHLRSSPSKNIMCTEQSFLLIFNLELLYCYR